MKKTSTAAAKQNRNISQPQPTIGLDLGDRNSWYCVVDEAGLSRQSTSPTMSRLGQVARQIPQERRLLARVFESFRLEYSNC